MTVLVVAADRLAVNGTWVALLPTSTVVFATEIIGTTGAVEVALLTSVAVARYWPNTAFTGLDPAATAKWSVSLDGLAVLMAATGTETVFEVWPGLKTSVPQVGV